MSAKTPNVKTVSSGGQIPLGKEYAGQQVLIDQLEEGVWMVKTAVTIPRSELWLWTKPVESRLDAALAWAAKNPPEESDLDALEAKLLATRIGE